jgi:hypothetical protein
MSRVRRTGNEWVAVFGIVTIAGVLLALFAAGHDIKILAITGGVIALTPSVLLALALWRVAVRQDKPW